MLHSYQNGGYRVDLHKDGTKVRHVLNPVVGPTFPESIDIKITDYCDLGCAYCHESSTIFGDQGDLIALADKLDDLPPGIELAIGGGNPLSHVGLIPFLQWAKSKGLVCNLTVNQGHLLKHKDLLTSLIQDELVYGLGISITNKNLTMLKYFDSLTPNIVFHLIIGVNDPFFVPELRRTVKNLKVLLLGYKVFGFGVQYRTDYVDRLIERWKRFFSFGLYRGYTIAFDNLAIEQLEIKKFLPETVWEENYMGDDFEFTMYIDAVKGQYAPTSRSSQRSSWEHLTIQEYFQSPHQKNLFKGGSY